MFDIPCGRLTGYLIWNNKWAPIPSLASLIHRVIELAGSTENGRFMDDKKDDIMCLARSSCHCCLQRRVF